jgi:hypothetical protein
VSDDQLPADVQAFLGTAASRADSGKSFDWNELQKIVDELAATAPTIIECVRVHSDHDGRRFAHECQLRGVNPAHPFLGFPIVTNAYVPKGLALVVWKKNRSLKQKLDAIRTGRWSSEFDVTVVKLP